MSLTPAGRLSTEAQRASAAVVAAPRFKVWQVLMQVNPEAGTRFISETELDGFADAIIASFVDGAVCDAAHLPPDGAGVGFGFWSLNMTNADMSTRRADPHRALSRNPTPALILRGECDYIAEMVAQAYRGTLPNATLVSVPNAGHLMYYEQPEVYLTTVRAFLRDQPLPLPAR